MDRNQDIDSQQDAAAEHSFDTNLILSTEEREILNDTTLTRTSSGLL